MKKAHYMSSERVYQIISFIVVGIITLLCLYPIIYILLLSITTEKEWVAKSGVVLWVNSPTLKAYKQILIGSPYILHGFLISVLRTVIGTACNMTLTIVLGYIVSRKNIPFRNIITTLVLITILFNGGMIPTYLVVQSTGIYNTFAAMIIPGLVDSWSVLVFKQFFENVPLEIEEAAQVDGVNELGMMCRIVIPMSFSVIAALSMFAAVGHWNAWFDASIYLQDDKLKPLQLILKNMFDTASQGFDATSSNLTNLDTSQKVSTVSLRMAVAVIGTLPILCIFPFTSKYFTKGVYTGAVKG